MKIKFNCLINEILSSVKYILISFCLFLSVQLFGQAAFTASVEEGCVPLTDVNFTADAADSYSWSFGNGGVGGNEQNVSTSYSEAGEYTVTLTAVNGGVTTTATKTIIVHELPIPDFIATNTFGCASLNVGFTGSVESGTITNWAWNYGDFTSDNASIATSSHSYTTKGTYNVVLIATDNFGCKGTIEKLDFVTVSNKPTLSFSAGSCTAPATLTLANTVGIFAGDGSTDYTITWDFGGTPASSTEKSPSVTFPSEGEYPVTITITDETGCSNPYAKTISIGSPIVDFIFDSPVCDQTSAAFTNNSSNGSNRWDFGGDGTSFSNSPSHLFNTAGTYPISLTVTASAGSEICSTELIKNLEVVEVTAQIDLAEDTACSYPFVLDITNSSQGLSGGTFEWTLPDGSTDDVTLEPDYTFSYVERNTFLKQIQDTYMIYLTVSNHNCTRSDSDTIAIRRPVAEAVFAPGDSGHYEGCAPLSILFEDHSDLDHDLEKAYWDFGDGDTLQTVNKTVYHTYTDPGDYYLGIDILDVEGCRDTSYQLHISVGQPSNPTFSMDLNTICINDSITFTNTTAGTDSIDFWHFSSDNNNISNCIYDPEVTFPFTSEVGDHAVVMYSMHNGCADTSAVQTVTVNGPFAYFHPTFSCEDPLMYHFDSTQVQGATSVTWDFGDLNTSTETDDSNRYAASGVYTVSLTAKDGVCPDYVTSQSVYAMDVNANLVLDGYEVIGGDTLLLCAGDVAGFDVSGSSDYIGGEHADAEAAADSIYMRSCYVYPFIFDWGDIVADKQTVDTVMSHIYQEDGIFNMKMVAKDINGCTDTARAIIISSGIDANIAAENLSGCIPFDLEFTDASTSDTTIVDWVFYFGNGDTLITSDSLVSDTVTTSYVDSIKSSFELFLIVTDTLGCFDTLKRTITASKPTSHYIMNGDVTICEDKTIEFEYDLDNSDSTVVSFQWHLNNGVLDTTMVTTTETVTYAFDTGGVYTVELIVHDTIGCTNEYTSSTTIDVDDIPTAVIYSPVGDIACYPETELEIIDTSINDNWLSRSWIIEDASGSGSTTEKNVTPAWIEPGDYALNLTTRTRYGCSHDTSFIMHIVGPTGSLQIISDVPICKDSFITFDLVDTSGIGFASINYNDGFVENVPLDSFPRTHQFKITNPNGSFPVALFLTDPDSFCSAPPSIVDADVYAVYADFGVNASIDSISDTSLCLNESLAITNYSLLADVFSWDFGMSVSSSEETPDSFNYPSIGEYTISLAIENSTLGCKDTTEKTIQVILVPKPVVSVDNSIVCAGDSTYLRATGGLSYVWSPDKWISPNDTIIVNTITEVALLSTTPDSTIRYIVSASDTNGCVDTSSILITVLYEPNEISHKDTITIGDSVEVVVNVGKNYNYVWSGGETTDFLTCMDCDSVKIKPSGPIAPPEAWSNYTVRAFNVCYDETYPVDILVKPNYTVAMPTAFTPGGDGINDKVYVKGWGIETLLEFSIYNRWGELLFNTTDLSEGWDGTYKEQIQPVDSYVYIVKAIHYNGEEKLHKGSFTIIK